MKSGEKMPPRAIVDETAICQLYGAGGKSIGEIATEFRTSTVRVSEILARNQIQLRPNGIHASALNQGFYYLASPYSGTEDEMESRYASAVQACGWLLAKHLFTYSPIVSCHPIAKTYGLPREFEFWQQFNNVMIRKSAGLVVLQIPGWEKSRGIADELVQARRSDRRLRYMFPTSEGGFELR